MVIRSIDYIETIFQGIKIWGEVRVIMEKVFINATGFISVLFDSSGKGVSSVPYVGLATAVRVTVISVHYITLIKFSGFLAGTE